MKRGTLVLGTAVVGLVALFGITAHLATADTPTDSPPSTVTFTETVTDTPPAATTTVATPVTIPPETVTTTVYAPTPQASTRIVAVPSVRVQTDVVPTTDSTTATQTQTQISPGPTTIRRSTVSVPTTIGAPAPPAVTTTQTQLASPARSPSLSTEARVAIGTGGLAVSGVAGFAFLRTRRYGDHL